MALKKKPKNSFSRSPGLNQDQGSLDPKKPAASQNSLKRPFVASQEKKELESSCKDNGSKEKDNYSFSQSKPKNKKKLTEEEIRLQDRLDAIKKKESELRARQIADQNGLPYIDLTIAPIETQAVWLIDEKKAKEAGLAVLHTMKEEGGQSSAQIALIDPRQKETQEIIEQLAESFSHLNLFVASPRSLQKAWDRYLDSPEKEGAITGRIDIEVAKIEEVQRSIRNVSDLETFIKKVPPQKASQLLEVVIAGALKIDVSDIHLEAKEKEALLRFRIDGVLQDVISLSTLSYHVLVSRIKLLSEMMLNRKDIAQDGRFTIAFGDTKIEVRVSVIPAAYGENIVIRVLNPKAISLSLEDLGFKKEDLDLINREIKRPNGMIITTGPTGSGKTTALYAFIRKVATKEKKIITLEDPVEYHLPQITQTQIEPDRGYTFAAGLRAILRQDPDIILVGEIRDKETAEIAIHAALTGHLLFSTLHTNDAAGAVPRLVEMGVNAAILSAALNNILAQRLVRRLCDKCKQKEIASGQEKEFIKKIIASMPEDMRQKYKQQNQFEIFKPGSCQACNQTGYKGRVGIFEIIHIDKDLEKLVASSPSHAQIEDLAQNKGYTTMVQDGVIKILGGITSVAEVKSAVGKED